MYNLEPLTPLLQSEKLFTLDFNLSSCHSLQFYIMKTLKLRAPDIDPATCVLGHDSAVEITKLGFDMVTRV